MSLAPLELEDLLSLVEDLAQEHSALDAGVVTGSPRWNWPRLHQPNFDTTSWLNVVGYADWMPLSDYADECGGVDLEFDGEGALRFHPPMRIDWQTLPLRDAALFAPKMERVLEVLSDLLELPAALRKPQCILPNVLWSLGNLSINQQAIPIYLARKFGYHRKEISEQLMHAQRPERGLILTTCRNPVHLEWPMPRQLRVVRLADLLMDAPQATLNAAAITRLLGQSSHAHQAQELAVQFNSITNTLIIAGNAKPWVLKGDKQIKAIAYLFAQLQKGRVAVSAEELLRVSGTRSTTVSKLFAGGPYEDYLASPARGLWGFR